MMDKAALIALIVSILSMILVMVGFSIWGGPMQTMLAADNTVEEDIFQTTVLKAENESCYVKNAKGQTVVIKLDPNEYAKMHEGDTVRIYEKLDFKKSMTEAFALSCAVAFVILLVGGLSALNISKADFE